MIVGSAESKADHVEVDMARDGEQIRLSLPGAQKCVRQERWQ